MKIIYQFSYLINGYLFFRCFEEVFEEERNENKEGNSRGATVKDMKLKDQNDEILGFDLVFVG